MRRFAVALITLAVSGVTSAQTPGMDATRPAAPGAEEAAPADAPLMKERKPLDSSAPKAETDHTLARCHEVEGKAREDCVREERAAAGSAAVGATRRAEPPTAPPAQNPR
jgi:hypothetical protein